MPSKVPFANCDACPLKMRKLVMSDLRAGADFTVVGESPGWNEVREGVAFVGPSGRLLWETAGLFGLPRTACNVTNAVLCEPPSNEEGKEEVLSAAAVCCKPRLAKELEGRLQPILLLGKTARESLFPRREGEAYDTVLNRWDRDANGRDVIATLHPAYVLRENGDAQIFFDAVEKFVKGKKYPNIDLHYEVVLDRGHLKWVLEKAQGAKRIVFDLETDQIDPDYNKVLLMAICFDTEPNKAYIVPARHEGAPIDLLKDNTDLFNELFWSSGAEFTGHNVKFDVRFLRIQYGHNARGDFDTLIAHYCLDENTGHGLKGLGARFLDLPDWEIDLGKYLKSRNDYYGKVPWNVMVKYAAMDVVATLHLSYIFEGSLREEGLYEWPFMNIKMAESKLFCDVECRGFMLDVDFLEEKREELDEELKNIKEEMKNISGGLIQNPNSPAQVAHYLYDVLKIPMPKGRKIKPRSTDKSVIALLKDTHPIIPVLKKHRKVAKVQSSYVINLLNAVTEDSIIRPDENPAGAETQRIAVHNPATQTMPRPGDPNSPFAPYLGIIRGSFIPRPGYKLFACDYNQAELCIAADLSQDPFLISVFKEGRDLHSEVAIAMYGPNFTKEQRMLCKMFNFSYLYGGTEHSFAEDAGLPLAVAIEFVRKYNEIMPRLKVWKDEQVECMMKYGYVQYRTGARRRFPLITENNRDDARKASFNSPCQGQASLMTSLAAWRAHSKLLECDAHILLLVHDSIIGEAPEGDAHIEACRITHDNMVNTATEFFPSVTWRVDIEGGYRWSKLTKMSLHA